MSSLLLRRSLVGFVGLSITLSILGSATGANAKPRWGRGIDVGEYQ